MKKIKFYLLISIALASCLIASGQTLSVEMAAMESCLYVNGSFGLSISKDRKLGFASVVRSTMDYQVRSFNFLTISNFTYSIQKKLKATIGGVYSNFAGFTSSIGMQYFDGNKNLSWMVFPIITIMKTPQLITVSMVQYSNPISAKTDVLARIQSMNMFSVNNHLFSLAQFRFGLKHGRLQYGLGLDFDFAGNTFNYYHHEGIFIQYRFF